MSVSEEGVPAQRVKLLVQGPQQVQSETRTASRQGPATDCLSSLLIRSTTASSVAGGWGGEAGPEALWALIPELACEGHTETELALNSAVEDTK